MIYGYARVSTVEQKLEAQKEALKNAGAEKIYVEKTSAKSIDDRTQLNELLGLLRTGDTLIVTKMDRMARNVTEGIKMIDELVNEGITLNVLNMGTFDGTPTSKLIRNILLSVAEWEREILLERQREGIEQAKKRGVYKGRKPKYTSNHKGLQHALELFFDRDNNKLTVNEIAEMTNINRRTIYRKAKEQQEQAHELA